MTSTADAVAEPYGDTAAGEEDRAPGGGRALLHRLRARARAWLQRLRWGIRNRRGAEGARGPTILVALLNHIGDIVAAEPVLRHLRREHPDAEIVWATDPRNRAILEAHPEVAAVVPVRCLGEWLHLSRSRAFDRVVDLHISGRGCAGCGIRLWKTGNRRTVNVDSYYRHGNLLNAFCVSAGLPILTEGPTLRIPAADRAAVEALALPARYAAIHCGSRSGARDWAPEKWRELTQRVIDELGLEVVEVGSEGVVDLARPGFTDLCGRLTVLQSAEVIRRATVFVGIDSGPAHLANAVGSPGVILLGHFREFHHRYVPYSGGYGDGSNAELVYADGPAAMIPVERVFEAVESRLEGSR